MVRVPWGIGQGLVGPHLSCMVLAPCIHCESTSGALSDDWTGY